MRLTAFDRSLIEARRNPDLLTLPLENVRLLDHLLTAEWGIRLLGSSDERYAEIERSCSADVAAKYADLYQQQLEYLIDGLPIPNALESVWYHFIAQDPLNGVVHSEKRTFIHGVAVLVVALIRRLGVKGPILDVGCHTGYHALLVARMTGLNVLGVDVSRAAVEYASKKAVSLGVTSARFSCGEFGAADIQTGRDGFGMVYCSDALPKRGRARFLQALADSLTAGGVCVLVGNLSTEWDTKELRRWAAAASLGFGLVDDVGGWTGPDEGFRSKDVLVLVKDRKEPLPTHLQAIYHHHWGDFQSYANAADTPWEEKTVAHYRAKKLLDLAV